MSWEIKCATCRYASPYGANTFYCKRHAPQTRHVPAVVCGLEGGGERTVWPLVDKTDWCGEWEEKV